MSRFPLAYVATCCLLASAFAGEGPPRLAGVPQEPAAWYSGVFNPLFLISMGTVLVTIAFAWIWRSRRQLLLQPAKFGWRVLARRMGLSRSERKSLGRLARAHGVASPATLMLCPSVFDAAAAIGESSGVTTRAVATSLRSKLFS